ncbi:MAG: hypothetical protein RIT45_4278 [Pseudomonadota bacterium]|jgi:hypothetical protein
MEHGSEHTIGVDLGGWLVPLRSGGEALAPRLRAAVEAGLGWGALWLAEPGMPDDARDRVRAAAEAAGVAFRVETTSAAPARVGVGLGRPPAAPWLLATRADPLHGPALAAHRSVQSLARRYGCSERQIRWAWVHRRCEGRPVAFPLDDPRALADARAAARVPLDDDALALLDVLDLDAPGPRPRT